MAKELLCGNNESGIDRKYEVRKAEVTTGVTFKVGGRGSEDDEHKVPFD